jgi:hypothetical protein
LKFTAFIKFSEINCTDYIQKINWNIKGKLFSFDRHSLGDVTKDSHIFKKKSFVNERIFKNIFSIDTQHLQKNLETQVPHFPKLDSTEKKDFFNDTTEIVQNYTNSEVNYSFKSKVENNNFKKIINNSQTSQFITNAIDNSAQNFIDVKTIEEIKTDKTENKTENVFNDNNFIKNEQKIEEIIIQKLEESNSYTEEQILQIENNLNEFLVSENYVTENQFNNTIHYIQEDQENNKKEVEKVILGTRKFFEDFLNN